VAWPTQKLIKNAVHNLRYILEDFATIYEGLVKLGVIGDDKVHKKPFTPKNPGNHWGLSSRFLSRDIGQHKNQYSFSK